MGLFHLNESNVEEAVKYFVKTLALDTRYYLAWNALGISHSMRGRLEESVQAYRKCLEINPQFTEAHNNLGTVYDRMGRLDLAETEWKTALLDPVFQSRELPYTNLARLYVLQDRLDEAFDSVQQGASRSNPGWPWRTTSGAQVYEKKNNLGEAVASYEAAVKIVPEDVLFSYNLGVASFQAHGLRQGQGRLHQDPGARHGRRDEGHDQPLPEADRGTATSAAAGPASRSGAFLPAGQVFLLGRRQLVDRRAHRGELQAGDLLVDLGRDGKDALGEALRPGR